MPLGFDNWDKLYYSFVSLLFFEICRFIITKKTTFVKDYYFWNVQQITFFSLKPLTFWVKYVRLNLISHTIDSTKDEKTGREINKISHINRRQQISTDSQQRATEVEQKPTEFSRGFFQGSPRKRMFFFPSAKSNKPQQRNISVNSSKQTPLVKVHNIDGIIPLIVR